MKLFSFKLSKKSKVIISIIAVILTALVVTGAFFLSQIKAPEVKDTPNNDVTAVTPNKEGQTYTFLFAGRDKVALNTDTIMVVSFNTTDYTLNILSIPRDTMSADVKRTVKKINAAYGVGGKGNSEQLKKEVEQIIGISIDKYAVINLDVFIDIIDLIGGVEVDVPIRMKYNDPAQKLSIDLQPGVQTLNGAQAMGFVRYRATYARGDLQRIETQQIFMKALAKKAISPSVLLKIPSMVNKIFDNLDTDFKVGELVWLASEGAKVDVENNLNMHTLPGSSGMAYNLSYYFGDQTEILALINEKFNPTQTEITSKDVNIATKSSTSTTNKKPSTSSSTSSGSTSSGSTSSGGTSGGSTSSGSTSGGNTSGGSTSSGGTSGGNTSGGSTSSGGTSGGNTSGGSTSSGGTSGGNTSGGSTSGDNTTNGDTSNGETGNTEEPITPVDPEA